MQVHKLSIQMDGAEVEFWSVLVLHCQLLLLSQIKMHVPQSLVFFVNEITKHLSSHIAMLLLGQIYHGPRALMFLHTCVAYYGWR